MGEHFFRELPLEFSSGGTVHNSVNADAWDVEGARESTTQRVKFDGVVELMRLRRLRAPKNPGQQSAYLWRNKSMIVAVSYNGGLQVHSSLLNVILNA